MPEERKAHLCLEGGQDAYNTDISHINGKPDNWRFQVQYIAHVKQDENGHWSDPHDLLEHLRQVASRASDFADRFGNGDWAYTAGLWHDLGKYKDRFQAHIRNSSGYEKGEGSGERVDHSIVGALYAKHRFGPEGIHFAKVLGYLIAGHHAGLPDFDHSETFGGALSTRWREEAHLKEALVPEVPPEILEAGLPQSMPAQLEPGQHSSQLLEEHLHLWIRMLFSCLVDADYLDTEAYMSPHIASLRTPATSQIALLKDTLDQHLQSLSKGAKPTPINAIRASILAQCRAAAPASPGVFSLTVPTGGGKTLSGMAFALDHALRHDKRRVIVAIPYTSIIEQTAQAYRNIFGADAVIEHHSNLNPDTETYRAKLATENWDAPIIVTTNVQLFESLFSARTSSCRKLHNIVDSVIILDEAQMLPPQFLQPVISGLKGLTHLFGCTVVLSTATQPVLTGRINLGLEALDGFHPSQVTEIIEDPGELTRQLQRVKIQSLSPKGERVSWSSLAQTLREHEQVLCIVNTRRDCRALYDLMGKGTVHLSALMCPEHRSQVIGEIKRSLSGGQPLRVISTQLIEAGVDIDFPVVYRAMAGFDSIAQAAGRCNREGTIDGFGVTYIFQPESDAPPGLLRKGQYAGEEVIGEDPEAAFSLNPEVFTRYFRTLYHRLNSFDEKGIMNLLAGDRARQFNVQFRTADSRFRLIEDTNQLSIVVDYQNSMSLVSQVETFGPSRKLLRKLQRFMVQLPSYTAEKLAQQGSIRALKTLEGAYVQCANHLYSEVYGLDTTGPHNRAQEYIV
jgi:CRISPR-associated endonuclease/helicase Cas3